MTTNDALRGADQIDVHAREFVCGDRGARFHQYFEPDAKPIGVELFLGASSVAISLTTLAVGLILKKGDPR